MLLEMMKRRWGKEAMGSGYAVYPYIQKVLEHAYNRKDLCTMLRTYLLHWFFL
jgi:hypothetical protein